MHRSNASLRYFMEACHSELLNTLRWVNKHSITSRASGTSPSSVMWLLQMAPHKPL